MRQSPENKAFLQATLTENSPLENPDCWTQNTDDGQMIFAQIESEEINHNRSADAFNVHNFKFNVHNFKRQAAITNRNNDRYDVRFVGRVGFLPD